MTTIEDKIHGLMDRLDHQENRIQPTDRNILFEALQRMRAGWKDVRDLEGVLDNMKGEIAKQSHQISEYKRLSLDMLSLFKGDGEKIATAERVEAWEARWNELNEHTGYKAEDYV